MVVEEYKSNEIKGDLIPLTYDKMFKKVFGDDTSKDDIKYLLKCVLNMEVEDVEIINNEILGGNFKDMSMEVDVIVKLPDKRKIVIEMNTSTGQSIINRNLFYIARVMSQDLESGSKYQEFHDHIQINFDVGGTHKRPIMRYRLREDEDVTNELSDKLTIYKIDVPYFTNKCYTNDILKLNETEKFIGLLGCKEKEYAYKIMGDDENMKKIVGKTEEFSKDFDMALVYDGDEYRRWMTEVAAEEKAKEIVKEDREKIETEKEKIETEKEKIETEKEKIETEKEKIETEKEKIETEKEELAEKAKQLEEESKKIEEKSKKIEEKNNNLVLNMLDMNLTIDQITKITGFSKGKIREISKISKK